MENSLKEIFFSAQPGVSLLDYRGKRGNLVVIAPHPDDDVLGAGGTMAAASLQGKGVFTVYVTDGRGSPRKDSSISDDEMARRREEEAKASLKKIGATGGFFLRKRSQEIQGQREEKVKEELRNIFQLLLPAEIFLPAPYERHLTHQRCCRLTIEAIRSAGELSPRLYGYSLWGSFWGEKVREIRDITIFIQKKVEAVLTHTSQIDYKNYHQGILGKNNYEAIFWESHELGKASFVEMFLDMTALVTDQDLTLQEFIRQDMEAFIKKYLG